MQHSEVSNYNVNLGTGFHNNHRFDIDPYCGAITSVPGSVGANSVFDGVTASDMSMFRTFPSVANDITIDKEFKFADFGAAGSPTDMIEFTNADVGASSLSTDVMLMFTSVIQALDN